MSKRTAFEELQARGLVSQLTHEEELPKLLTTPVTFYVGFDPTAKSLHVGSMLPMFVIAHLQRFGHRPIILVGGATGMIGDPSGRSEERLLLMQDKISENLAGIRKQLEAFVSFEGDNAAIMVDNYDWTSKFSFIDWLRDVGKHFTVNYMMQKKSVQLRLENREQGISYTEFSYMLLQAHDFLHLYQTYRCKLQCGGDDQWGNITAGMDLIRKKCGQEAEAFGLTWPLLTTASGEKFGKSAGNAVWLDPELTSPYHFYQYWIQTTDQDVEKLLKYFSFLSLEEIAAICEEHLKSPENRLAQIRLATEVTRLIHGDAGLQKAQLATDIFFGKPIQGLSDADLLAVFANVPSYTFPRQQIAEGIALVDASVAAGAYSSKGEARRMITGGGLYVNNNRVTDEKMILTSEHFVGESSIVLRKGKKDYFLLRFE